MWVVADRLQRAMGIGEIVFKAASQERFGKQNHDMSPTQLN
jgi:hypothetical protein